MMLSSNEAGVRCTKIIVESCGELHDLLPSSEPDKVASTAPVLIKDIDIQFRKRSLKTQSARSSVSSDMGSLGRRCSTNPGPREAFSPAGPVEPLPCPPPTLLDTMHYQWLPLLIPAAILIVTIVVCVVVSTPPPTAISYLIAYAVTFAASALWLSLCNAVQTKHLLTTLADRVPLLLTTPDAQLSDDMRVRYVQSCVYNCTMDTSHALHQHKQEDTLAFMRGVIIVKTKDLKDGHCIADQMGTVLWCNEVLANYFGYADGSLVGQNVRILMPEPYASQHDAILRNYGGAARSNIVGHRRRVPVVDRSGTQSTALLGVEEYIDPADSEVYVFLGSMTFPDGSELEDPAWTVQQQLNEGITDISQCCTSLATFPNSLVVINASGIIQWVNDSATLMLQYGFGELIGKNVSCLMAEEHAKTHDAILDAYQERAAGGLFHVPSRVVGRSRDLYAKTKSGDMVRIFLTVKRVDRPSHQPQDCLFVGTLLLVQKQKKDDAASFTRTRSAGTLRSATGSSTHTRIGALSSLMPRKCTLVALELVHLNQSDPAALHKDLSVFFNLATGLSIRHKGVLHHPIGDRLFISLNVSLMNNAHRSSAGSLLHDACQQWKFNAHQSKAKLYAAGASGTCVVGQFMSSTMMLSQLHDICVVLLRAARDMGQEHPLIDSTLLDDLQFAFSCRPVNVLSVVDAQGYPEPSETVHELQCLKAVEDNEWMYQIAQSGKRELLLHWRNCWSSLLPLTGPPNYIAALQHLSHHMEEQPEDAAGRWLQDVLVANQTGRAPALHHEAPGKQSYVLQYCRTGTQTRK
eukprot:GGOE01007711.1.p1 GENE.GGOE01007711.1~~GGOE01007711.1.p1  ORF type:complete len:804 (+),score=181.47 GGOE01007711.1:35-2446(+)